MPTRNPVLTVDTVADRIAEVGLLPVIVIDDPAHAAPLAEALVESGLHTAEVTFRTPHALDAGARFVVSPGFSAPVVEACRLGRMPVFPGVSSATDIHRATEAGLDVLKFFPAEASGGVEAIAALAAPFPEVRFVPTGGIGPHNVEDYLRHAAVCAAGGSWMVPGEAMRAGDWNTVTGLCRRAIEHVRQLRR
jgi:2-dehydro-3-deoxyphosphogluconate aldolase/(4S)-4-hydroxy-2-oxoglutarate aldolase